MRPTLPSLGCLLLILAACAVSPAEPGTDGSLEVSRGTSFGMCLGYCETELVLAGATATLTERSRDPKRYPTRERSIELTAKEWKRIRAMADRRALRIVEGVHGCPDCADGGAEWVEIRTAKESIRATFDHGRTLGPIADLQAALRAVRLQFPDP
jgi:hypothetical protein